MRTQTKKALEGREHTWVAHLLCASPRTRHNACIAPFEFPHTAVANVFLIPIFQLSELRLREVV